MPSLTLKQLEEKEIVDLAEADKKPAGAFRLFVPMADFSQVIGKLSAFPNLGELYFSQGGRDPVNIPKDLPSLKSIQSLFFSGFKYVEDFGNIVSRFSSLPNIKQLTFETCDITLEKFRLCKLESFKNLENIRVTDATSQYIPGSLLTKAEQDEYIASIKKTLPNVKFYLGTPFDEYDGFTDLGSDLPEKGTAHITNEWLKKLYWHLNFDLFRAATYALAHLDEIEDKLATLKAARHAFSKLIKSYKEFHMDKWTDEQIAKEYAGTYFGKNLKYFKDVISDITKKIEVLKKEGKKSEVFEIYLKQEEAYEEEISSSVEEFIKEEELDSKAIKKIVETDGNPKKTLVALKKLGDKGIITANDAAAINAVVGNALLSACSAGTPDLGMDIIKAYSVRAPEEMKHGTQSILENLITHMLAVPGFTTKKKDITFVLNRLNEQFNMEFDDFPKVFFNLSCVYALSGDKSKMLEAIKKAKLLAGKEEEQFKNDSSFKKYIADKDFLKAIKDN